MEALFQASEIILEVQRKRNNKKITKKKKEGIYPHNSTQLEIFVTEQTHNYSSKIAPKYTD